MESLLELSLEGGQSTHSSLTLTHSRSGRSANRICCKQSGNMFPYINSLSHYIHVHVYTYMYNVYTYLSVESNVCKDSARLLVCSISSDLSTALPSSLSEAVRTREAVTAPEAA